MIKAKNLTKKFKKQTAVDNISFEVKTGKVTGFLGPNGAGKSTTMRLLLGLDNGSGQTTFGGKHLSDYSRPAEVVGILLEAKAFHPTRTPRRHLGVLAAAGQVADSRVDEVLDLVGLKSVAKKKPGKFSLGMSQRLGLAAAILAEPKYLILDEPANGLDPEGIAWLRKFLKDYAARGNAVFVSSHLLSEMNQLADDVLVIARGKLIASTDVGSLLKGSSRSGIFVRSPQPAKLAALIRANKWQAEKLDKGWKIHGISTDKLGKLAFDQGLPLAELSGQTASLEDVFLELTEGQEEFAAKDPAKGKS